MIIDEIIAVVRTVDYVRARDLVRRLVENLSLIEGAKPVLATAYAGGDAAQRRFLVDGILEHLFEVPTIRNMFSDWREDPHLGIAFSEAMKWAEPVNQKRTFLSRVAELCIQELRNNGIDASLGKSEIGIDSIEITWEGDADCSNLVLDCDYEFASALLMDIGAQIRLAKYATDRHNWELDEYAPWQCWVRLHS